ncbi:glycosyltransferase [Thermodesulfobacteriota bacterium]
MKVLCVLGKYQYGDASRGIGTEYAAFLRAIERLGHNVMHFDSWDRSCFSDFKELNQALLDTVERERPDVMLAVQMHYEIWLETLEIIKHRGDVATICWTTDDSWKYHEFSRFVGNYYHGITTTYPNVVPQYIRDGIPNVLLTQWAASADSMQEPIPAHSCRYQISFVGANHGDRSARIAKLQSARLDISCFGHGWPKGSVDSSEIPNIMRNSVISINFANSRGGFNQIKARNFEVPGAGGFLLAEQAEGLRDYYTDGKEIVVFENMDDLIRKARYYLTHPAERDAIAMAGNQRTLKEHTYDQRMKDVLDFAVASHDRWIKSGPHKTATYSIDGAIEKHRTTFFLKIAKVVFMIPCCLIWGRKRGIRAARRILFELSWRFTGKTTYTASGWPGRLFYKES